MSLRVATYNVCAGGGERLPRIAAVLAAVAPDVVALQELRGHVAGGGRADPAGTGLVAAGPALGDLAAGLGLRAYVAPSRWGQPVAVLVRADADVRAAASVGGPLYHAAVRVTLGTSGGPLTVLGTHLCPYRGWLRRIEVAWLRRRVDPRGHTVLAGDLNTLDPWTDHRDRLRALPPTYRARHLRRGRVDAAPVAALAHAGLVDAFRQVGRGPADTVPTGYRGAEFPPARLDYVLLGARLAPYARACRVIRTAPADTASDHYPLVADLDLDLA